MVVSHCIKTTYILQRNRSKYPTTVLYRFKTVHTVLADFRLRFETFLGIEVTAFFKP